MLAICATWTPVRRRLSLTDGYSAAAIAQIGTRILRAPSPQPAVSVEHRHQPRKGTHQRSQGVNLDEEAARLIQFQQAYQAAAKYMQIAQGMFDTLLQTVR